LDYFLTGDVPDIPSVPTLHSSMGMREVGRLEIAMDTMRYIQGVPEIGLPPKYASI
jgi:hypothetical protein